MVQLVLRPCCVDRRHSTVGMNSETMQEFLQELFYNINYSNNDYMYMCVLNIVIESKIYQENYHMISKRTTNLQSKELICVKSF